MRERLRPALTAAVPPERRPVVDALAIVRWDEHGLEVDDRLRVFVTAPAPPLPDDLHRVEREPNVFYMPEREETYRGALEGAMVRVLALSRQDAELVSDRFDGGSMEFRARLEAAFTEAGHLDLSERVNEALRSSWAQQRDMYDNMDSGGTGRATLAIIAALAPPASLTQVELRRMDALADLFATTSMNRIRSRWPTRRPETAAGWVRSMAELGGFDLGVLGRRRTCTCGSWTMTTRCGTSPTTRA